MAGVLFPLLKLSGLSWIQGTLPFTSQWAEPGKSVPKVSRRKKWADIKWAAEKCTFGKRMYQEWALEPVTSELKSWLQPITSCATLISPVPILRFCFKLTELMYWFLPCGIIRLLTMYIKCLAQCPASYNVQCLGAVIFYIRRGFPQHLASLNCELGWGLPKVRKNNFLKQN